MASRGSRNFTIAFIHLRRHFSIGEIAGYVNYPDATPSLVFPAWDLLPACPSFKAARKLQRKRMKQIVVTQFR
jgi:hypothetical protein